LGTTMTKTTLYHTPNGALAVHQSSGDGPPIVLLHSNSTSARAFSRQLEGSLGRRRRKRSAEKIATCADTRKR